MRRSRLLAATAIAATAAASTLGIGAGIAGAATPPSPTPTAPPHDAPLPKNPTLAQIQAAAVTDISNRVAVLKAAAATVQAATDLGSNQAALLAVLQGDPPALQQLGQKIAGDVTVPTAQADFEQIFTNFRVYALVLPVTRTVLVDDRLTNTAGPRLTAAASRIAARETPTNQSEIQPLLADLASKVSAASSAVDGQAATLLGYTPAQWNANHHLLASAHAATKTARGDLVAARSDAKQARSDLK
jgi:hypothetical protein